MKKIIGIIFLLFLGLVIKVPAEALTFNVVVLPSDLNKVCENYYCYPEVSEIISDDVIKYFNSGAKVHSPTLFDVRKTFAQNQSLKNSADAALRKFGQNEVIDFPAMKAISRQFSANSVLLISNSVIVENSGIKRNVWEILEISSALNISYPYVMETNAVLIDTVNDLVMWSGSYTKKISDNNDNFIAQKSSQSYAKLSYLRAYSNDILSKTIAQNVILRFFPKTVQPVINKNDIKPSGSYFRFESTTPTLNKLQEKEEINQEKEENYGEMIYGI